MGVVLDYVRKFKWKYPGTVSWRLRKHCKIIEMFLNPGEEVRYAFAAQKNEGPLQLFETYVVALTDKRILMARKYLLWGYKSKTITPDLFNDAEVSVGLVWGKIIIDTVKEEVVLSNISKKALPEIETNITEFMMEEKKKYKEEAPKVTKSGRKTNKNGYKVYDDVE